MKYIIANLIIGLLTIYQPVWGKGTDYVNRANTTNSCMLFANNAYQAADNFSNGVVLQDLLKLMESAPMPETKKHRAFQAIQFVWKNQLDNPQLAYTIAMGLCLKPKDKMAPMDEPWITSPRTSASYY